MKQQKIGGNVAGDVIGGNVVTHATNVVHASFGANHGGQQIVANDAVHIHVAAASPVPRVKVVIQPGPEHIGDEQKAKLKELVAEVVRLEGLLKRAPKSFASVWAAVNGKLHVSSYHLIPSAAYPKAEKYLREWIGRLSSAKSAPARDGNWRNRRYSYIFTNVKQLGGEEVLRRHLQGKYGNDSLKGLADADLETVYRLVAGWKKVGRAPGQAGA